MDARTKMKLVLVGNGMAGVRTLEELLKIAPDLYDITVFGSEPHPNYNRILLSPVLAGLLLAIPMSALSYLLVVAAGWFYFHEPATLLQVVGGAAILTGVWLLGQGETAP